MADKLASREIVRQRCPGLRIKQVYRVYERAEQISLDDLPQAFVLKVNGASGLNLMVLDKCAVQEEQLRKVAAAWLRVNYFESTQEPCYRRIESRVFAEELLLSDEGWYPLEFRIFCFHGKAGFIDYEVVPNLRGHSVIVDTQWNPLPARYSYARLDAASTPRPLRLAEAVEMAERLAQGLDFVRVDLYDLSEGLAFGEITHHPWGGLVSLAPHDADELLGRYWEPYSAVPLNGQDGTSCLPMAEAENLIAGVE